MFVNDVLVPVKLLINDTSTAQVKRDQVRYFHVELPHHAVILAEGLPVESYLDLGDRTNFEAGTVIGLLPDFGGHLASVTALVREARGVALLVMIGEMLEAARHMVTKNAPRHCSIPTQISLRCG